MKNESCCMINLRYSQGPIRSSTVSDLVSRHRPSQPLAIHRDARHRPPTVVSWFACDRRCIVSVCPLDSPGSCYLTSPPWSNAASNPWQHVGHTEKPSGSNLQRMVAEIWCVSMPNIDFQISTQTISQETSSIYTRQVSLCWCSIRWRVQWNSSIDAPANILLGRSQLWLNCESSGALHVNPQFQANAPFPLV